jgi:hypothetical protein
MIVIVKFLWKVMDLIRKHSAYLYAAQVWYGHWLMSHTN